MANVALWVQLEIKNGKEAEIETLLRECRDIAIKEKGTFSWYALKLGATSYGIFETFKTNKERESHLAGEMAKKLEQKGQELLQKPPTIERIDVIASKLPELE